MPNVPYPPGTGVDNFDTCVKYLDDPLTITFKDSGMIFPTATGIFTPDLPTGIFAVNDTIGPYKPSPGSNGSKLIVYFQDFDDKKMYTNTITIQTNCP